MVINHIINTNFLSIINSYKDIAYRIRFSKHIKFLIHGSVDAMLRNKNMLTAYDFIQTNRKR